MNKKFFILFIIFILSIIIGLNYLYNNNNNNNNINLNIWWQIPWSIQWQIVQVLKNTEILNENWLNWNFKWFLYWAPLNEAWLAWDVDLILTADQPAAVLLSKAPNDWIIVWRLMYNRVSLYTPIDSDLKNISDLKWKNIALPFWAAVQRFAIKEVLNAWLKLNDSVNILNLWMEEQVSLINKWENNWKWWEYYSMAWFDPVPAILEEKWLIKNLSDDKIVALILVSRKSINKNPNIVKNIRNSFNLAWDYYKNNKKQANDWFNSESKLNASENALKITEKYEPNFTQEIRLDLNNDDIKIIQEAADFLYEQKLIKNKINMKDFIY